MTEPIETPPEPEKTYAPWVGVVMAWFLPGSAHVLSGKPWTGIAWYSGPILLPCLFILSLGTPGTLPLVFASLVVVSFVVWLIALLVSSYRPVRRMGWKGWLVYLLFCLLVAQAMYRGPVWLLKIYCVEAFVMASGPMAPTLLAPSEFIVDPPKTPDRLIVNKMIYRFSEPKRGDIAVFLTKNLDGSRTVPFCMRIVGLPVPFCMRIVGLPGETVDIESPYALIGGKKLTEPPIFETMAEKKAGYSGYVSAQDIRHGDDVPLPITLGPDEYFLLGDNSAWSRDSRFFGPVKRKDIIGKAIRIYWPINRFGDLE